MSREEVWAGIGDVDCMVISCEVITLVWALGIGGLVSLEQIEDIYRGCGSGRILLISVTGVLIGAYDGGIEYV